jgi:hypothetical protein
MKRQLLIHSLSELKSIYLPILKLIQPNKIGEIGIEFAGNTKILIEFLNNCKGELFSIEPSPNEQVEMLFEKNNRANLYKGKSLDIIKKLPTMDTWFIDGDHNWYTVFNELQAINSKDPKAERSIIFLHDIGFPWAYRDLYYNPKDIPAEDLNEHCWQSGVLYDGTIKQNKGFRGCGQFAIALNSGGDKNGVLCAVEDFIIEHPNKYNFYNIPAIFGLGILVPKTHNKVSEIDSILSIYSNNTLLKILEENRLSNYLKVIELQDEKN